MNVEKLKKQYSLKDGLEIGSSLNEHMLDGIESVNLRVYLESILPERKSFLSCLYLLTAEDIDAYCDDPDLFPHFLNREGYIIIGETMGADPVVVDKKSGAMYWFNRSVFLDGLGTLLGQKEGEEEMEINRQNLESVGIFIGNFTEDFLTDLIQGKFSALFKKLG